MLKTGFYAEWSNKWISWPYAIHPFILQFVGIRFEIKAGVLKDQDGDCQTVF
ncbi:MAG: hypothetical protein KTR30_11040 [Saprospiraceae bacterium]|nr:hypothetical protein [Saprospiraceae bacterium]